MRLVTGAILITLLFSFFLTLPALSIDMPSEFLPTFLGFIRCMLYFLPVKLCLPIIYFMLGYWIFSFSFGFYNFVRHLGYLAK